MKRKTHLGLWLVVLFFVSAFTLNLRADTNQLLGTIPLPAANATKSTDIAYVDQQTETLYFADRTNARVVAIDAENGVFLGGASKGCNGMPFSFVGVAAAVASGPNGVVSTPDKKVWAGDGDSTVKIVDVDPASPCYLQIVAVISTAAPACAGAGTCNRADEIAYDPADNMIAIANDEPTSMPPYLTFINATSHAILGQLNFSAQGNGAGDGLEQPVWDPAIDRFLQTLPVTNADGTGSIAVINPATLSVERVIPLDAYHCSPSGEALGPNQHIVVACAIPGAASPAQSTYPLVLDVSTGLEVGSMITQIGGGDEVYFNPGNNQFVVTSTVNGVTGGNNPAVLGAIDANTGAWLQNSPPPTAIPGVTFLKNSGRQSGNLAAFAENDHVFVIVTAATPPATDVCPTFGGVDYGCVAVFGPSHEDPDTQVSVIPRALPAGSVGTLYAQQLVAEGGAPPYTWTVVGGATPPGLTLSPSGLLSGTPTSSFLNNFYVVVHDSAGQTVTPAGYYSITIH